MMGRIRCGPKANTSFVPIYTKLVDAASGDGNIGDDRVDTCTKVLL